LAALALGAALLPAALGCGGQAPARAGETPRPATESGRAHHFDVERAADGLIRPTWVGAAPGDPGALWVAEQPGRVLRLDGGRVDVALDLRRQVLTGTEQGLLGVAFHPGFAANRRLYLHWSDRAGDTRVAEFRADARGRRIVARPARRLLHVRQPEENHKGGHLAFGPDGRLYLGLGDGGGAFDPRGTAQDPRRLLGKLLALDVDRYERGWEIVLTGLRNPWRFAFDNALGEVWIGDVGQDRTEEVDRVRLELDEPPKNLGWSVYEGTRRLDGHRRRGRGELVFPAATYTHADGCSVTGGVVYGGARLDRLSRRYVYGDFCSGALWSLRAAAGKGAVDVRREHAKVPQLTHIGTDGDGELVLASAGGAIYRAVPAGS
jgi:glucose/arabinose dehydrogenase